MKPPGPHPGGMAKTADPTGVVPWFSRSSSSRRRWIGTDCRSTSAWYEAKTSPETETLPAPGAAS